MARRFVYIVYVCIYTREGDASPRRSSITFKWTTAFQSSSLTSMMFRSNSERSAAVYTRETLEPVQLLLACLLAFASMPVTLNSSYTPDICTHGTHILYTNRRFINLYRTDEYFIPTREQRRRDLRQTQYSTSGATQHRAIKILSLSTLQAFQRLLRLVISLDLPRPRLRNLSRF